MTTRPATRALRPKQIYGKDGPIPVGKTKFNQDIIQHEGGDRFIPGTRVPRLRLARLGPRTVVGFADEVADIVEALRRERDEAPA
jgi:hypothetical protein